jgi:hypothetical protein
LHIPLDPELYAERRIVPLLLSDGPGKMVPEVSKQEGENGDEEAKSTTADAEEVLLDDQDEAVDTTEIIDADIEKDDT